MSTYIIEPTAVLDVVNKALLQLPPSMRGEPCKPLLLAIALQESGLATRVQYGGGPAHGLWQNERGGMVHGVLSNGMTRGSALLLCQDAGVAANDMDVWQRLAVDDVLAAGFARLGLWADSAPLPPVGDAQAGWVCYNRNWRPGKPRPADWPAHYALALETYRSST